MIEIYVSSHVSVETLITRQMIPRVLIAHQQRYGPSDNYTTWIYKVVHTTRFWNNLHQVLSQSKDW